MGFLISGVLQGRYALQLSDADYATDQNAFTVIVGKNATGKSRLLRKVVSAFLNINEDVKEDRLRHDGIGFHKDILLGYGSRSFPAAVIGVSTGRHDRFPMPGSASAGINYHYVSSPATVEGTLSESLKGIFRKSLFDPREMLLLGGVFAKIGFAPIISFRVIVTSKANQIAEEFNRAEHTLFGTKFLDLSERFEVDNEFILDSQLEFAILQKQKKLNVEIDFYGGTVSLNSKARKEFIFEMLDMGLLEIDGLTLFEKQSKRRLQYGMTSSGQRCILAMLLGIAGAIRDEALICIDEPEISLHPKWQEEVIDLLQVCFSGYKGCHFLIATHSPQVVSGMVSGLSYVLDIETGNLLLPSEYSNRSADYQLAEVFHTPGRANEYMIRICLVLISKLNNRQKFDNKDKERLHRLQESKYMLDREDPVYHLIEQISALTE